ncbi:hypothetical protein D3C73_1548190 [compost metagenome]
MQGLQAGFQLQAQGVGGHAPRLGLFDGFAIRDHAAHLEHLGAALYTVGDGAHRIAVWCTAQAA